MQKLRNDQLESAVLASLAKGDTCRAVATECGISMSLVNRIKAKAKANGSETKALPLTVIAPKLPDSLLERLDHVVNRAVAFVDKGIDHLDPQKRGDIKLVVDTIVKTLSDVSINSRKLQPTQAQSCEVSALSDAELQEQAKKTI